MSSAVATGSSGKTAGRDEPAGRDGEQEPDPEESTDKAGVAAEAVHVNGRGVGEEDEGQGSARQAARMVDDFDVDVEQAEDVPVEEQAGQDEEHRRADRRLVESVGRSARSPQDKTNSAIPSFPYPPSSSARPWDVVATVTAAGPGPPSFRRSSRSEPDAEIGPLALSLCHTLRQKLISARYVFKADRRVRIRKIEMRRYLPVLRCSPASPSRIGGTAEARTGGWSHASTPPAAASPSWRHRRRRP